jgi:hypothetical protein
MVSVSHEREDETERRLRVVLGRSTISRLPGAWAFDALQAIDALSDG